MWLTNAQLPDHPHFEASEESFEAVWKFRGWEPCEAPVEADPDELAAEAALIKALAAAGEPPPVDEFVPPEDDDPEAAPSGDTKE